MSAIDRVIAARARRQHGQVASWQLRRDGVTATAIQRRAADGRLHRRFRGVYAVGHPCSTTLGFWIAAVLAYGPDAALSHRSAAALWGLIRDSRATADVTTPGARRSRKRIRAHRATLLAADVTVRDGIPVTSVARTLLDLAGVVSAGELKRAYERAERLRILDVREIRRLLDRCGGHRGARALRELMEYDPAAAARALSELEVRFLDFLRAHDLPTPQVNVVVEGYTVDAYWPEARLVVELQSHGFHSDRETFARDHQKHAHLKHAGLEVLPLTDGQLNADARLTAALLRRLVRRGRGSSRSASAE